MTDSKLESGQLIDLSQSVVAFDRDGIATVITPEPGPPPRVDGYTVGAPQMTRDAPHNGELHPDGDELLYVVTGRVHLVLEETGGDRTVPLGPGQAFIVPKGTWHKVVLQGPTHLIHMTPGPGGDHRPL